MPHRSLEQRSLEREAAVFWSKLLADIGNEPPLQPDVFAESERWGEETVPIPKEVVLSVDRFCKGREDLHLVFFMAALAAAVDGFTRCESKWVLCMPTEEGAAKPLVPVPIGPLTDFSFKQLLEHLLESCRNIYRYMKHWQEQPDARLVPEGYARIALNYEPLQRRELTEALAKTNGIQLVCHIGQDGEGNWSARMQYDAGRYSPLLMRSLAESAVAVLKQASLNPGIAIAKLELRSEREIAKQLAWNDTASPYDEVQTIHGAFSRIAALYSNEPSVVSEKESLTYRELNERSDAFARRLILEGVAPGERICVMLDRSTEWVVAALAVWKAGGVYVPIDPSYPAARIEYMLADSNAALLIAEAASETSLAFAGRTIDVSEFRSDAPSKARGASFPKVASNDMAYMIYTSGSTGLPKGVMVEHRGVLNLQAYFAGPLGICPEDRILQFASASFDASIWELSMALLIGGQLHIAGSFVIGDMVKFMRFLGDRAITAATLPPAYAIHLNASELATLRLLVTAGSESNRELLNAWNGHVQYVNAYGPTETTVCATAWYADGRTLSESALVPIGKPLPNTQATIVNARLQPLPSGVPGELAVSGAGLARGYWNRPEMTSNKFVQLPHDGVRAYLTGDLARWTSDGDLIFLGRLDRQVKIRGYRIETEEVRHVIMEQPGITEAVVVAKPDAEGDPALAAYYTAEAGIVAGRTNLQRALAAKLPGYMVPTFWIQMQAIPITPNGKPDLKALPDLMQSQAEDRNQDRQQPSGTTEIRLAGIWRQLLGIEQLGRDDDFFQLGGHSMKAARMAASLYRKLGVNMPLEEMFRYATLRKMADWIDSEGRRRSEGAISPAPSRTAYPLSSAQLRLFAVESARPPSTLYVMPFAFWIDPAPDPAKLEAAFVQLIERHEPLRTSFGWEGTEPVQRIHRSVLFRLEHRIEDPEQLPEITNKSVLPFILDQPPLLRATLVHFTDGRTLLMLYLHHIIADGLSLAILMKDLTSFISDQQLPPLQLQYKDYCHWITERQIPESDEAFWELRFKGYTAMPEMSIDWPRTALRRFEGKSLAFEWSAELTDSIRRLSIRCGATVHLTMLAAYCVMLSKITGTEDIVVGSLHAGREHPDAMDMVGMFVHTLAHRSIVDPALSFESFVRIVAERVAEDYEHSSYPFERLVRKLQLHHHSRNPLFDTMFVLQNIEFPSMRVGEATWQPHVLHEQWSRFDLVFQAWEKEDGLLLWITYSTSLFRQSTVERLSDDYRRLLALLSERPDSIIADLDLSPQYRPISSAGLSLDFQF